MTMMNAPIHAERMPRRAMSIGNLRESQSRQEPKDPDSEGTVNRSSNDIFTN